MRVADRTLYENSRQNIGTILESIRGLNEQITSSKRINRPADDPVGFTTALNLKKTLAQIDQYGRNIHHAQNWIQTTESALQQINTLVERAKVIAVQMATGTYNADQRSNAALEVQNILEAMVQAANTQIDGRYVFSGYRDGIRAYESAPRLRSVQAASGNGYLGTATATRDAAFSDPFILSKKYVVEITTGGDVDGAARYRVSEDGGNTWGAADDFAAQTTPTEVYNRDTGIDLGVRIAFTAGTLTAGDRFTIEVSRYNGDGGEQEAALGRTARVKINQAGDTVFGSAGDGDQNVFDILAGLKTALEANDVEGIQDRLQPLTDAQTRTAGNLADAGSRLNGLEVSTDLLSDLRASQTRRLSEVEDLDVIQAMTELNERQRVLEAALYSASQISRLSFLDFMK